MSSLRRSPCWTRTYRREGRFWPGEDQWPSLPLEAQRWPEQMWPFCIWGCSERCHQLMSSWWGVLHFASWTQQNARGCIHYHKLTAILLHQENCRMHAQYAPGKSHSIVPWLPKPHATPRSQPAALLQPSASFPQGNHISGLSLSFSLRRDIEHTTQFQLAAATFQAYWVLIPP